jgi:hypothetical protein
MKVSQVILPHKMNSDSDLRLLKPEECRRKLNLRSFSTEGDNVGANENFMGNIRVPYLYREVIIGSVEDIETNSIIFFVYNPMKDRQKIIRYTPGSPDRIDLVLRGTYQNQEMLNFKLEYVICDASIIGGVLYWTFGYFDSFLNSQFTPPRKLNIVKAINFSTAYNAIDQWGVPERWDFTVVSEAGVFTGNHSYDGMTAYIGGGVYPGGFFGSLKVVAWAMDGINRNKRVTGYGRIIYNFQTHSGSYVIVTDRPWQDTVNWSVNQAGYLLKYFPNQYFGIDWQVLDVIKPPPLAPPTAFYESDLTIKGNKVQTGTFQFKYRYIYDGYETSVFSATSKIPLPNIYETIVGSFLRSDIDNCIKVWVDTGSIEVRTIEIAARNMTNLGMFC